MPYLFEAFRFDPGRGLTRSGKTIALEPLALELLGYLIDNRTRIVTRDELNERLWDGRAVSDAALSTQIRAVRRALGDDRFQQRFIRTYPRRGFSFVAPVQIGEQFAGEPGPGPKGGTDDIRERAAAHQSTPTGATHDRRALLWVAAAAACLVLVIVGIWTTRETGDERPGALPALSIAVLPFDNLSGDPSLDYLADAFTEDLVTDLSRIRDAFVISRSTTFTYRGRQVDPGAVADELGVRYVLEGSLRVHGDSVRINAQLIDAANNSHLWSDRYDRRLSDLFDLQDNVTGRIASVLRAELRVAENRRQDPKVEDNAWNDALRGNVILYNHQSIADYQEAYALLSRAVSLDPTISSAWSGLAFVHYVASVAPVPGVSQPNSAELSLEAAQKAVQGDSMNAEPYWLVGAGYARLGQPEKGMGACETAIELNPNMDCGHVCAGLVHMSRGEPEEAIPFFQHALKLNPLFRPFTKEKYLGLAFIQSGRTDLAIDALNRSLAKAPKDAFANLALAAALELDGRADEARESLSAYRAAAGAVPTISSLRTSIGWMGPETERMLQALERLGLDGV